MSETSNPEDGAVDGTPGGETDIMRAIVAEGGNAASDRKRVRSAIDEANDRNAQRPPVPKVITPPTRPAVPGGEVFAHSPPPTDRPVDARVAALRAAQGPIDPEDMTVRGPLDLLEEVVRTAHRYGALAHWPNVQKARVLGLVTTHAKQLAIADKVVSVVRRDSVERRAYRERRKFARRAASLLRSYGSMAAMTKGTLEGDPVLYAEGYNYMLAFLREFAELPPLGDDEPEAPDA